MKLWKWQKAHPTAELRVVTLYRVATVGPSWDKQLADLGLAPSATWKNLKLSAEAEKTLINQLGIRQYSGFSFLLDPGGCVIHSDLSLTTSIPVIERALLRGERCIPDRETTSRPASHTPAGTDR